MCVCVCVCRCRCVQVCACVFVCVSEFFIPQKNSHVIMYIFYHYQLLFPSYLPSFCYHDHLESGKTSHCL